MEIGSQIKKHRTELGLSQEALAEKVYVSRQTVSNWENEKNYPDIHSLVLLSSIFGISLDELVKGDIETMKKEIRNEDIAQMGRQSIILGILTIVMILSSLPLIKFLGIAGTVIWALIAAVTLIYAFRLEKFKKAHDISTYREIVAFMEGRSLEGTDKAAENGKRPYQNALKVIAGAVFALILTAAVSFIITLIKS